MTAKRLIARLDIKGPHVVRGVHLEGLRVVGTPDDLVSRYAAAGIDELLFIDTVASLYGRNNTRSVVERTAQAAFIPLTVGGGVRTLQDVDELLRAGADRVAVNSAAVRNPALVTDIARSFGSQCVVAAIDAKRRPGGGWDVLIDNAREATGRDALEWAREVVDRGAGEVLLTSVDADGLKQGCDLNLTRAVAGASCAPVVASGGPGTTNHVVEAFVEGKADGVALGSLLHFQLATVADIRRAMAQAELPIRMW